MAIEFSDNVETKNKQKGYANYQGKHIVYKDILKSPFDCMLGSLVQNRLIAYVFCENKSDPAERSQKV